MELGIKLSFIEDIRDSLKKRYYELKKEYKAKCNIADGNKQRAVTFARGMYESANEHFLEVKLKVEGHRQVKIIIGFMALNKRLENYRI